MARNMCAIESMSYAVCSASTASQGYPALIMTSAVSGDPRFNHEPTLGFPAASVSRIGFFISIPFVVQPGR